jgi:hypothetical protein
MRLVSIIVFIICVSPAHGVSEEKTLLIHALETADPVLLNQFFTPPYRAAAEDSFIKGLNNKAAGFKQQNNVITAFNSREKILYRLFLDDNGFIIDSSGFFSPLISKKTLARAHTKLQSDMEIYRYWSQLARRLSLEVFNSLDTITLNAVNPTKHSFYDTEVVMEFYDGNRQLIEEKIFYLGRLSPHKSRKKLFKLPPPLHDTRYFRATLFFYRENKL